MSKQIWKPGNMLYPLPVVLVSVAGKDGEKNVFTVAWTGTVCSDPPMVSISVRPQRYSYQMIKDTGEFVLNLEPKEFTDVAEYLRKQGRFAHLTDEDIRIITQARDQKWKAIHKNFKLD